MAKGNCCLRRKRSTWKKRLPGYLRGKGPGAEPEKRAASGCSECQQIHPPSRQLKPRRCCWKTEPESRRPVRVQLSCCATDKSYPLRVSLPARDSFPSACLQPWTKKRKGRYFGPYPRPAPIRESLSLLAGRPVKVRQLRRQANYRNRTRPASNIRSIRLQGPVCGPASTSRSTPRTLRQFQHCSSNGRSKRAGRRALKAKAMSIPPETN